MFGGDGLTHGGNYESVSAVLVAFVDIMLAFDLEFLDLEEGDFGETDFGFVFAFGFGVGTVREFVGGGRVYLVSHFQIIY